MRRFRFAAAFVITGCGAPRSDPYPLVAWHAELDATPLDASPADAEPDYAYLCTHFDPAHPIYCNPPPSPPPDAMPPQVTMNPPPPALIVDEQLAGSDTVIAIALGSGDGVGAHWTGKVIDERGRPVAGGAFVIFRTTRDRSYAKVKLSPDQLHGKRVQLDPPLE